MADKMLRDFTLTAAVTGGTDIYVDRGLPATESERASATSVVQAGATTTPVAGAVPKTETDGLLPTAFLGTGTADGTTYLRGDKTWATVVAGIGGSTGGLDNRLLRSDGTGGATLQASSVTVDDSGNLILGAGGAGYVVGRRRWLVPGEDLDVSAGFSGSGLTNDGTGGSTFFSLPDAVQGLEFLFVVEVAHDLVLVAAGTDVIYLGGTASSAGGTLTSSTVGSSVLLSCSKNGRWTTLASGSWVAA